MTLPPGSGDARALGGGSINRAFQVTLADGRVVFVKTRPETIEGEYEAEAAGLAWLAAPGLLRTPAVLEVSRTYLALEWIEPGSLSARGAEELGRALAGTHLAGAEAFNEILSWKGGIFHEEEFRGGVEVNIEGRWEMVLMEAVRLSDECHAMRAA